MRVPSIAILVTIALMLAACGGDGDDGREAAGTTASRGDTATATTSTTEDELETVDGTTGDSPTDTEAAPVARPGPFAVRVNELLAKGEFDRAWQLLHPVQQQSFTASELAGCWALAQQFGPAAGYRVTKTQREPSAVPGGPSTAQPATTVTIEVVLTREADGEESESVLATFSHPVHEVDGELRWSVSESLFEAIEDGEC